jgi:hypothetical protein
MQWQLYVTFYIYLLFFILFYQGKIDVTILADDDIFSLLENIKYLG